MAKFKSHADTTHYRKQDLQRYPISSVTNWQHQSWAPSVFHFLFYQLLFCFASKRAGWFWDRLELQPTTLNVSTIYHTSFPRSLYRNVPMSKISRIRTGPKLLRNVYSGPVCYAAETAVVNYPTQNRKMAEVTMIIPKYTWMISFISLWISHMIVAIRKDVWNSYKSRPRTTLIITATRQLFARWRLHYRISVLWVLLFWSCLGLSRRSAQS